MDPSDQTFIDGKARSNAIIKIQYPDLTSVSYCLVVEYQEDVQNNTFFKEGTVITSYLRSKQYNARIFT